LTGSIHENKTTQNSKHPEKKRHNPSEYKKYKTIVVTYTIRCLRIGPLMASARGGREIGQSPTTAVRDTNFEINMLSARSCHRVYGVQPPLFINLGWDGMPAVSYDLPITWTDGVARSAHLLCAPKLAPCFLTDKSLFGETCAPFPFAERFCRPAGHIALGLALQPKRA